MTKKTSHFSFRLLALDFYLLNISFFLMNYWKHGTFVLSPLYSKLLVEFYIFWLVVSLLIKKFHLGSYTGYWDAIILFTKSAIFNAYSISFMVVFMGLPAFSRLYIFGTCALLFLMNLTICSIYFVSIGRTEIVRLRKEGIEAKGRPRLSIFLIITDFLLMTLSFFVINYYKRGTFLLPPHYEKLILVVYGVWFITSFITGKFDKRKFENYFYGIASCTKAVILMTVIMSFLIFALRLFYFSRGQIFGSFLMLLAGEVVIYYLYFILGSDRGRERDIETFDQMKDFLQQQGLPVEKEMEDAGTLPAVPVKEKVYHVLDFFNPWLFDFIDNSIALSKISRADTAILSTDDIFNVKAMDNNSLRLFINLHKTNDIRWVNRYFLKIYNKLKNGGYFIGNAETIELHRKRFFARYPKYFAEIFYVILSNGGRTLDYKFPESA